MPITTKKSVSEGMDSAGSVIRDGFLGEGAGTSSRGVTAGYAPVSMAGGSGSCAGSVCGGSIDDSGAESDVVGGVWVSDTGGVVAGREADGA